jgi:FkbM family methyltransferase
MRLTRAIRRWVKEKRAPRRSFGLHELDLKVKPWIDFRRGFFIEAGANNGLDQSNTAYFEKYMGWRGVLVEPVPELAEQCRRNRPNSRVFNAALVPFDFTDSTIRMNYANLMSVVEGGMKTREEELEHIRSGCEVQNIETYTLDVPARTLTSILDEAGVRKIDFFSLDVEGFELSVLRGLDLDRYRPKYLLIEARYREEIDSYLRGLYEPITELSFHDVLYRRRT